MADFGGGPAYRHNGLDQFNRGAAQSRGVREEREEHWVRCRDGLAQAPVFVLGTRLCEQHVVCDCLGRSEEHTSELQSLMRISYAVFCLTKKTQLSSN